MTSSPLSCFGLPPYGDSTSMMNVKNMEVGLSPPYGDGIETVDTWQPDNMFSPPYGDSMIEQAEHEIQGTFSPPYGDCIRMTTPKYPVMELPSPLRG